MKNKIGIIISIILTLIFIIFIDYDYAKRKDKRPIFTIKIGYNEKYKSNNYIGFFYKVFECNSDKKSYIYSKLSLKQVSCPKKYIFNKDNVYINYNKIPITKEQYNVISPIYLSFIDEFKSTKEVENAYYLAYEYQSKFFEIDYENSFLSHEKVYYTANFHAFKDNKWQVDYSKNYCAAIGSSKKFEIYNYENGECTNKLDLSPTKKFCELLKNDKSSIKDIYKECK